MKPEIKVKWVNALRSGEYKQGNGKLNRDGAFCCLGVLTDLAAKENLVQWKAEPEYDWVNCVDDNESNFDFLTSSVIKWAELEQHVTRNGDVTVKWDSSLEFYGYFGEDYESVELSDLNDDKIPFSVLADLIECQL